MYKVYHVNIADIVELLNKEPNSVNRLRIANEYRINHNLESILDSRITKYTATNFDNGLSDRYILASSDSTKKCESKDIKRLNDLYISMLEHNITERQYKIQSNSIKSESAKNITFDNNKKQWITLN